MCLNIFKNKYRCFTFQPHSPVKFESHNLTIIFFIEANILLSYLRKIIVKIVKSLKFYSVVKLKRKTLVKSNKFFYIHKNGQSVPLFFIVTIFYVVY